MNPLLDKPCFVSLPRRGLVRVSGPESFKFLQRLITNDLSTLGAEGTLHSCLLSPQGKFLHDFYITQDGDAYLLNCEDTTRCGDLVKSLDHYKLRSNVMIEQSPSVKTFLSLPDWRISYTPPSLPQMSFESWDQMRIRSGRPDGSRDAEIGLSTLAELNLDTLAVSYTKGCYVGQELVARMHNRNLGKKHLVPLEFSSPPPLWGADIRSGDVSLGLMRSSCGLLGLALMSFEAEDGLKHKEKSAHDPVRLLG